MTLAVLTVCAFSVSAYAGTVSYEANSFPEVENWERIGSGDVIRSLHDGIFSQFSYNPGILDAYRRSLEDFDPSEPFFIEWRVETDVPSTEFALTHTPVVVSASDSNLYYYFVITDTQVLFSRSNFLPTIFVDIEPEVLHTYRLELYGADTYLFSIDDQPIDSGTPLGPFLNQDPSVHWGVRRFDFDFTTQWDYIRYGNIPEPATASLLLLGCLLLFRRRANA